MSAIIAVLSGKDRSLKARLLRAVAWFASKPYGGIVSARNLCYERGWLKSQSVDLPVISVGNLTVGGTGKTPTVALICRKLRALGIRVAIVSRGYGAAEGAANDEALELELQLPDVPHLQNPDRVAAARIAKEELDSQVIVMDDGFQHRRLRRDLDIVLLDATEPFGYGQVLPRGLLRESISSLRRAGVVIVTRADQVDQQRLADIRNTVQRYAPNCVWAEAVHQPLQLRNSDGSIESLHSLENRLCYLFCGIGNPAAFQRTVIQAGGEVVGSMDFPDHHRFTADDMQRLASAVDAASKSKGGVEILVLCTGKDLSKVNLVRLGSHPLYALDIELHLRFGDEALNDRLNAIVSSLATPSA